MSAETEPSTRFEESASGCTGPLDAASVGQRGSNGEVEHPETGPGHGPDGEVEHPTAGPGHGSDGEVEHPETGPGHGPDGEVEHPTAGPRPGPDSDGPNRARLLFRYLAAESWTEYRAILGVFAGTFFAEFTPEEIAAEPAVVRASVEPAAVPERLESLRRWGNLTVSSSVGNPSSIEDYYRRHNRYLITRSGQEVFQIVEGVLSAVDEIADVQAGRLRDLHRALSDLGEPSAMGFEHWPADSLADRVRTVFDLHQRFTTELTQFFADLNLWQSRYDLNAEEIQLFAGVLVSYVSEQLAEIERMTRPIARSLQAILPRLAPLLGALRSGLAARVDDAGLGHSVAVRRLPGTAARDWEHLAEWFVPAPGQASRLDQLTRQALGAVRTLTANVTRLSRAGLGAASRRADFLRLAGFFDGAATSGEAHQIAAAAFGLGSCRRLATLSADADDPEPATTAWRDAPRAVVPVSLRKRGDTTPRGRTTPIRDRARERELMWRDRELKRVAGEAIAAELLACADDRGHIDGAEISVASFSMLRDLISRSGHDRGARTNVRTAADFGVRCTVTSHNGASTVVECPEGRLLMHGLVVTVAPDEESVGPSPDGAAADSASVGSRRPRSAGLSASPNGAAADSVNGSATAAPARASPRAPTRARPAPSTDRAKPTEPAPSTDATDAAGERATPLDAAATAGVPT